MTGASPSTLPGSPLGIYVHVPFCRQLCPYCDFAVAVRRDPPHEAYCDALLREWSARSDELAGRTVRTLYFGGGTPAYWAPGALQRFVDSLGPIAPEEVTIEANPHDITPGRLDVWASAGIDRISLGAQSFDDDYLSALGRDHDGAVARRAVERIVEDGRFRTSVDLIFGGPRHDASTLRSDLATMVGFGPDHVSAYELTVEPATVFGRRSRAGTLDVPEEAVVVDFNEMVVDVLGEAGYERYEVSNYGRDGDIGVHNAGYWSGAEYIGLGTGAHSLRLHEGVHRRANVRSLREYLAEPKVAATLDELTAAEHLGERLFLAARTRLGVSKRELHEQFDGTLPKSLWHRVDEAIFELVQRGWLEASEDEVLATPVGLDFADSAAAVLWEGVNLA